jgi:hypothetical protein
MELEKKYKVIGGAAVIALAASLFLVPVALAQPPYFDDVPPGHMFYDQINWIYENGITSGCSVTPPLYCPDAAVSRGQMAVFMYRLAGNGPGGAIVDADTLDGQDATTFASLTHDHFSETWPGSSSSHGLAIENMGAGHGVVGEASAASGTTYGVFGISASTDGRGVYGVANATSGTTYGVYGESASGMGYGVFGDATAVSGTGIGVKGVSASTDGWGVYGIATAVSGYTKGVFAISSSTEGKAVHGRADSPSGETYGVYGGSESDSGRGVFGFAGASSGTNYGVYGRTNSPSGYAVYAENTDPSGVDFKAGGSGIIESTAPTTIAVSPLKMVVDANSSVELRPDVNGDITVRPDVAGWQMVLLPLDLPTMLFGTSTKLQSVQVCYRCVNANGYIALSRAAYIPDSGTATILITDHTDYNSTSWECYTITDASPDEVQGSLFLNFQMYFSTTGSSQDIQIGKITLTLVE